MIVTGIFLFLLGTKLGHAATKTEVKYGGPNNIAVNEEKDDEIVVQGLGSPPFAPNFFHQGSNFFFSPQFMVPGGFMPFGIERLITPFQPPNQVTVVTPEVTDKVIEKVELIDPEPPLIEIEETIQILPQVEVEIDLPDPPKPVLVQKPYVDVEISEETVHPSELFISEVNVRVENEIPPPPELPPLIISEIPRPVFVQENKRVILIPSVPEIASFYPPSIMLAKSPLIPTECTQNIIMERFLPNIAFESGKIVELISIPARKRVPVVSSFIYSSPSISLK